MLERIDGGEATPMDLDIMASVCDQIMGNCLCVLGDSMAMPIGTMIKHFRAEFETVEPDNAVGETCTTTVKVADAPLASDAVTQSTSPIVCPGAGVPHDHPAGVVAETNAALKGRLSVRNVFWASVGPLLVTVIV